MLRPPQVGAYSDKYKRAGLGKTAQLGAAEAAAAVDETDRTRELRREAAHRRRF